MIKKRLLLIPCLAAVLMASCHKQCRCYRYDGVVEIFTEEELESAGTHCTSMENEERGLKYSLCEYSYWD